MPYSIKRHIGIDMGHRVPTHGSKCAHEHGHRYEIWAEVTPVSTIPVLRDRGEQQDMVLDFGFLKDVMMDKIDRLCDHGITLWIDDPHLNRYIAKDVIDDPSAESPHELIRMGEKEPRFLFQEGGKGGSPQKLLIVPFIPTAERLAEFWFGLLKPEVWKLSENTARLVLVEVFETPNGVAIYRE